MNRYHLKLKNYVHRALTLVNHYAMGHLESLLSLKTEEPRHPPVFFLGAPRSGSTLAVQVITDALDVGYISNCHCRWFGAPALAERLFHPIKGRPLSDYKSQHGTTKGSYAPAECGEWWYRFFRRNPPYVTLKEVDPRRMRQFRRSVVALTNAFDRPILFKNLYASLRIQAIAHYLPESLFIVMHRNEVDNGHSLLETRKKVFGNYDDWWSMEPPDIERLKILPVHEQVIEQIRYIHTTIGEDLHSGGIPRSRRFELSYEDFCDDPAKMIDDLQAFLLSNGCQVSRIGPIPKRFMRRDEVRIDKTLYDAMARYSQDI